MPLIASISGVRGTLGGRPGENLTPLDLVKFTTAYVGWLRQQQKPQRVVLGRDARPSGAMLREIVGGTLSACGVEVIDLGLTTTPTVEIAVSREEAGGGIVLTASHNPIEWNALKLLNERGEFLSSAEGEAILAAYHQADFTYESVERLGALRQREDYLSHHVEHVLALELVNREAIAAAGLRVGVDAVNSVGGSYVPALLRVLGVEVHELYCEPTGYFPHNPEPLPAHLTDLRELVRSQQLDLGIVVDPDVDRLAFVSEDGEVFGEEYTLVAVADYVLQHRPGPVVTNLSSSRALRDVAQRHGQPHHAAAVGEANVVAKMKEVKAVIGGEGNGGVIDPAAHYGRDALVGIGLFLSHLATCGQPASVLRQNYPDYAMTKAKIALDPAMDLEAVLEALAAEHQGQTLSRVDGVKIDFADSWVHLRKSNTEPIVRIYTEAPTQAAAEQLASDYQAHLKRIAEAVAAC